MTPIVWLMKLATFRRVAVVTPLVALELFDALSEVQHMPRALLVSVLTVPPLVVALADLMKLMATLAPRAELRVIDGTSLRALLMV